MITNFTKPSTIQIISNWVEKKGKKNTFIRIISRSSVPAFASHASPCWLLLYPRRKEQIHIFSRRRSIKAIQIEIKKKENWERERVTYLMWSKREGGLMGSWKWSGTPTLRGLGQTTPSATQPPTMAFCWYAHLFIFRLSSCSTQIQSLIHVKKREKRTIRSISKQTGNSFIIERERERVEWPGVLWFDGSSLPGLEVTARWNRFWGERKREIGLWGWRTNHSNRGRREKERDCDARAALSVQKQPFKSYLHQFWFFSSFSLFTGHFLFFFEQLFFNHHSPHHIIDLVQIHSHLIKK